MDSIVIANMPAAGDITVYPGDGYLVARLRGPATHPQRDELSRMTVEAIVQHRLRFSILDLSQSTGAASAAMLAWVAAQAPRIRAVGYLARVVVPPTGAIAKLSTKRFAETGADGIDVMTVPSVQDALEYVRSRKTTTSTARR